MVAPTTDVLDAFGVGHGTPELIDGGMGRTWRVGDIVIKPTGLAEETRWRADLITGLGDSEAFRMARPVRTSDGDWLAGEWEAWRAIAGEPDSGRPDDAIRSGIAFHRALVNLPRPGFLDVRDDPWTVGDRMAWDEMPVDGSPTALTLLGPLVTMRRPVDLPSQVVHGDLLGNVLYTDGLPPAVIDWPIYYRPAAWASAVIVVDAVCWYNADIELIYRWAHLPQWRQMLIRGLIYRVAADDVLAAPHGQRRRLAAYRVMLDALSSFTTHRR